MRHEIEIEGLPEGLEPVSFLVGSAEGKEFVYGRLQVRRKVRKYDWSKTLNDVLVCLPGAEGFYPFYGREYAEGIAGVWQPNIHGKCPVDPEASWVRIRYLNGETFEALACDVNWAIGCEHDDVVAYQFIRLADGVEW